MITNIQLKDLSKFYKIDEFTIFREYLQILILSYIYQERKSEKIVFKGGTALRLMYGSSRFSEDLDFSTTLTFKEIKDFVLNLGNKTKKELPELKFTEIYQGKEGLRYNIKYESKIFKFPLNLRLDFHIVKSIKNIDKSVLTTRFPVLIFPTIYHLNKKEILSEKLRCLKTRFKGRDIFDIWYLFSTGEVISNKKYSETYKKNIQEFDDNDLARDLGKFLPLSQRAILPELKKTLLKYF
ncbi:MAG: nucleotidyl transferase AbiEii/AbiGii toxin family protein [bacterium]|nr:MAG: nucleotidyl transferase AbiEii/AbiGii toxin family protein [bacterium]